MADEDDVVRLHVLTLAVIRAGIETLQSQRIHEHFPAYLHLRQRAITAGSLVNVEPVWRDLGTILRVPGGPPTKPYYRPFSSRATKDPTRYWLNENLAGSYAPSSLRSTFMLNASGDGFTLPPDHAQKAFEVLLKETKVPAWALAAFYLRNYAFSFSGNGGCGNLLQAFKEQFQLAQGEDFQTLFDDTEPGNFNNQWFEALDSSPMGNAEIDEGGVIPGIRELTADDLAIGYAARAASSHGSSAPDAPLLAADDSRLATIERLLQRYGGVILTGPPGTSKSLFAGQIADRLTGGDRTRREDIQFHQSYQFEDFMEGYRPRKDGSGFEPRDGVFLRLAKLATEDDRPHVLVIDELSRADVGRVFGEALTYIERSKRGLEFQLPSGASCSIPENLYLIATMNPLDRGVDEVDAAFERRFAKVDMPPNRGELDKMLDRNQLDGNLKRRLLGWFDRINAKAKKNPQAAVGHAYFYDVVDSMTLQDVWDYQLKYHVQRAFRYDEDTEVEIINGWNSIFEGNQPAAESGLTDGVESDNQQ